MMWLQLSTRIFYPWPRRREPVWSAPSPFRNRINSATIARAVERAEQLLAQAVEVKTHCRSEMTRIRAIPFGVHRPASKGWDEVRDPRSLQFWISGTHPHAVKCTRDSMTSQTQGPSVKRGYSDDEP